MSLLWQEREKQLDREMEAKFKAFRERNLNLRWHEEKAKRDPYRTDRIIQGACAVGIIIVCLVLMFTEYGQ